MVDEEQYCLDILNQLRAARAALRRVERGVLEAHAQHCLRQALASGDAAEIDRKMAELTGALERYTR